MFENPSSGGLYVEPGRYIAKVVKLEPTPPTPQFPEAGPGIKWVFNLQDAQTKNVVQDDRGFPGEFWQFSSAKMTPNAKARKWATALLGREIDLKTDTGESIGVELLGKKALALIGENDKGRTAILSLSALPKANGTAAPKAAPAREPAAVGASVAAAETTPEESDAIAATIDSAPDDEF